MTLGIDEDAISAVLLADGWHDVDRNDDGVSTFSTDAYELVYFGSPARRLDLEPLWSFQPKDDATGFYFCSGGEDFYGPMSSVLCLRQSREIRERLQEEAVVDADERRALERVRQENARKAAKAST
jgi:hypothetical protein